MPGAGRNRPRQGRRIAAALALGLVLAASPLFADRWYVHYENAERALSARQWREAVEQLRQALERKGDSGVRVRSYGMKVVDYFPYLKLGIAYHHLGQPAAALEAFDTEERLGAVQGSPAARAELERYRKLAGDAARLPAAAPPPRPSPAEIVAESLAEARRLAGLGRLQEAMNTLGPALAADPAHAESLELMASLRSRVVAEEQRRREAAALAGNLEKARDLLARGEAGPAAGLLRDLLAQGPNEEAERLLARAQSMLVAAVAAATPEPRSGQIAAALLEARRLEGSGKIDPALASLETVFALDPGNAAARELRDRLLATRRKGQEGVLIQDTLKAAGSHLTGGRFEEALSAANRVLALDRGNQSALGVVRQAYAAISRKLLGVPGALGSLGKMPATNLPPAIRFADLRQEVGGERVEIVETADFRLTGVAIDSSPVKVSFLVGGRPVEGVSTGQAVGETFITEFSLRRRLPAGATALTVVATDPEGLRSESHYDVVYRRPWYLSPWLWGTAVVALGMGVGGFVLRRRQQSRRRRERKFNPYVAGGPVFDQGLFFGREPLIQRILQTVHNNSLLLHGERRIGKTSLLHQVERRLSALADPAFVFHPVYVDLQGTPEEKLFATLADAIFDALRPVVGESDREPALVRAGGYTHHDLVRELHGLFKRLEAHGPKRPKLVLLIDEVDELNHYDPRVSQSLRSLFMKRFAESMAAVVAGVRIRKEWEKETSPWFNFFEEIEVDALPPAEARRLVEEPVRGTFRFEPAAARRIVELTGGRPFQIQRRCLALVRRLHEEGRRTVTVADVEALEAEEAS